MPVWITLLPTILNALLQLAKLLLDMSKNNSGADIKACSVAIKQARETGDTAKLTELIDKMAKGTSCE